MEILFVILIIAALILAGFLVYAIESSEVKIYIDGKLRKVKLIQKYDNITFFEYCGKIGYAYKNIAYKDYLLDLKELINK